MYYINILYICLCSFVRISGEYRCSTYTCVTHLGMTHVYEQKTKTDICSTYTCVVQVHV